MRLHCVYFLAPEYARELRGGFLWRSFRKGFKIRYYLDWLRTRARFDFGKLVKPEVFIGGDKVRMVIPSRCPTELIYVCMPFDETHLKLIQDRANNGQRVVVDVVGNVWRNPSVASEAMREAGATVPQSHWDWWTPERQRILTECMASASAITTPWQEMIPFLQGLTRDEVPVFHVPDLHMNHESVQEFRRNVLAVLRHIGYDL